MAALRQFHSVLLVAKPSVPPPPTDAVVEDPTDVEEAESAAHGVFG